MPREIEPIAFYGWKQISQALGCSAKTAGNFRKNKGMPVRYMDKTPYCIRTELEDWLRSIPQKSTGEDSIRPQNDERGSSLDVPIKRKHK